MPAWLVWALLISGGSAVFFWKKANPGKSLNPTSVDGEKRPWK